MTTTSRRPDTFGDFLAHLVTDASPAQAAALTETVQTCGSVPALAALARRTDLPDPTRVAATAQAFTRAPVAASAALRTDWAQLPVPAQLVVAEHVTLQELPGFAKAVTDPDVVDALFRRLLTPEGGTVGSEHAFAMLSYLRASGDRTGDTGLARDELFELLWAAYQAEPDGTAKDALESALPYYADHHPAPVLAAIRATGDRDWAAAGLIDRAWLPGDMRADLLTHLLTRVRAGGELNDWTIYSLFDGRDHWSATQLAEIRATVRVLTGDPEALAGSVAVWVGGLLAHETHPDALSCADWLDLPAGDVAARLAHLGRELPTATGRALAARADLPSATAVALLDHLVGALTPDWLDLRPADVAFNAALLAANRDWLGDRVDVEVLLEGVRLVLDAAVHAQTAPSLRPGLAARLDGRLGELSWQHLMAWAPEEPHVEAHLTALLAPRLVDPSWAAAFAAAVADESGAARPVDTLVAAVDASLI